MKDRRTMLAGRLTALTVISVLAFAPAAHAQDIKVGLITGLSGGGASYGASMRQGVEMAMQEVNDAGGIKGHKLTLDVADDASDPAQSVLAMQRLVNDQVDIVVGGWGSSQVLANMEVAERAGMPYIVAGASNPRITNSRNKWSSAS
jgi:branched-chain amino acid transport system substrate-binding protein